MMKEGVLTSALFCCCFRAAFAAAAVAACQTDHPTPQLLSAGAESCITLEDVCMDQQQFITCKYR